MQYAQRVHVPDLLSYTGCTCNAMRTKSASGQLSNKPLQIVRLVYSEKWLGRGSTASKQALKHLARLCLARMLALQAQYTYSITLKQAVAVTVKLQAGNYFVQQD